MTALFPFLSFLGIPSFIFIGVSSYPALGFPESTEIILIPKSFTARGCKKPQEYIATNCPSAASITVCLDISTKEL